MGENTTIEYIQHSWNPWLGCDPVHTGCLNCYAQAYFKRMGIVGKRRRTTDAYWKKPLKWNQEAACVCVRQPPHRWVCPQHPAKRPRVLLSLCDPFEDWDGPIVNAKGLTGAVWPHGEVVWVHRGGETMSTELRLLTMSDLRRDMLNLVLGTGNLDWLLLTKRSQNARLMLRRHLAEQDGRESPPGAVRFRNVWLLYSASDQETLEKGIDDLRECRDLVPVLGLSLEPLVGPVDLRPWLYRRRPRPIDWVIVGFESGPKRRPGELQWIWDLHEQCKAAGVPLFIKQGSAHQPGRQGDIPEALWKIKEFPEVNHA